MASEQGFSELPGTELFSQAVSQVTQICHRVCFVIESNKQDKLASKQWQEGRVLQEISDISGAGLPQPVAAASGPVHMHCNVHNVNKQRSVTQSFQRLHVWPVALATKTCCYFSFILLLKQMKSLKAAIMQVRLQPRLNRKEKNWSFFFSKKICVALFQKQTALLHISVQYGLKML